jgi:hypothetical protein
MKYTPDNIKNLKKNQVFVFGSNEAGIHGGGAARIAFEEFGADWGQGFGFRGQTFAIPTKDWNIQSLSLNDIQHYVLRFLDFASLHPEMEFLVTKIGCGLAGFTVDDIAPLFLTHNIPDNVSLPVDFYLSYK